MHTWFSSKPKFDRWGPEIVALGFRSLSEQFNWPHSLRSLLSNFQANRNHACVWVASTRTEWCRHSILVCENCSTKGNFLGAVNRCLIYNRHHHHHYKRILVPREPIGPVEVLVGQQFQQFASVRSWCEYCCSLAGQCLDKASSLDRCLLGHIFV